MKKARVRAAFYSGCRLFYIGCHTNEKVKMKNEKSKSKSLRLFQWLPVLYWVPGTRRR
jgi:hypothetical protein